MPKLKDMVKIKFEKGRNELQEKLLQAYILPKNKKKDRIYFVEVRQENNKPVFV